jgi:hypothetical protein
MLCERACPACTKDWLIRSAEEATRETAVPRYACIRQDTLYEFGLLTAFLNESIEHNLNTILHVWYLLFIYNKNN